MLQTPSRRALIVLLLVMTLRLLPLPAARAQTPSSPPNTPSAPDTTLGSALRSLASRAAVVFVGQITRIDRSGDVVLISFRVDQPILGEAPSPYVLREWAGLWPNGEQRYSPGQRAMVFLHPATSSGLSSPVDGAEGMIPVIPQGAEAIPVLDTRHLDTRLQRNVGEALPDASRSAIQLTDAAAVVQHWQDPTWVEPVRRPLPIEAVPTVISSGPVVEPISTHRLTPSIPAPQPLPSVLQPAQPVRNSLGGQIVNVSR